ncbi:hypothetical protein V8C35DRAFT_45517 [Trichoderma chlorosporum]
MKSKNETKNSRKLDFDDIMQNIYDAVEEFDTAINTCRDGHIQTTHNKVEELLQVSVKTSNQMHNIEEQVSNGFENIDQHLMKQGQDVELRQKQGNPLHEAFLLLQTILQSKEDATTDLVTLLRETQKKNIVMAARLAKKHQQLQLYHIDQHLTEQNEDVELLRKQGNALHEALFLLQPILQSQEDATTGLVNIFRKIQRKNISMAARVAKKYRELQPCKRSQNVSVDEQLPKGVITLRALLHTLSAQTPDQISTSDTSINFERLLAHRDEDLEVVLNWSSRMEPSAQVQQAHSVFDHDRFFLWMQNEHSDLLLIDGNLFVQSTVALEKISAMSIFCANFILSMRTLASSHIVLHFHCGLHAILGDEWYGSTGLIRSAIIQLLITLYDRDRLDLNILDRHNFVQDLENDNLETLCIFWHWIIRNISLDTTIFLVIDGISYFDFDLHGLFKELVVCLKHLRRMVEDNTLRPKFKVLMTSPTKTSLRLGEVVGWRYRLALPISRLNPLQL